MGFDALGASSAPTRAAWSGSQNCSPGDTSIWGPEYGTLTSQIRAEIAAKQPIPGIDMLW